MADPIALAKQREDALKRMAVSTSEIATALGIEPPVIRQHAQDRTFLEAHRLKAIADWLDSVAATLLAPATAHENEGGDTDGDTVETTATPRARTQRRS